MKASKVVVTREPEVTQDLPLVPFKVLQANIPFYRDQKCTDQVTEATLAILQALDPEDSIQELDIVPTTKIYSPGQYVTMILNNKELWEECWYKDPKSGEIQKAFSIHVDFIGKVIDPSVVQLNKEKIADLEKRVEQKIQELAARRVDHSTVN